MASIELFATDVHGDINRLRKPQGDFACHGPLQRARWRGPVLIVGRASRTTLFHFGPPFFLCSDDGLISPGAD